MTQANHVHADDIVKFLQTERTQRTASIAAARLELGERNQELIQMEAELEALSQSLEAFRSHGLIQLDMQNALKLEDNT